MRTWVDCTPTPLKGKGEGAHLPGKGEQSTRIACRLAYGAHLKEKMEGSICRAEVFRVRVLLED